MKKYNERNGGSSPYRIIVVILNDSDDYDINNNID